jgi:uncharacterized SAM-binding protein YcdF (DUF218 family)
VRKCGVSLRSDENRQNGERGGIFFRLISLLILAALIFLIYLVRRPILREMGEYWIVEDPISSADALIILSDDNLEGSRAEKAAELYDEHRAPVIVASGRMLRPYMGISDLMQRDLTDRGVPPSAIVAFRQSANDTIDEAQALKGFVEQKGWHHVIVVTSNYHTRRARYIFRKVFPANVQVDVAGARDPRYDPSDWWEHRVDIKIFLNETAGMVEAMWILRHEPRQQPSNAGNQVGENYRLGTEVPPRIQVSKTGQELSFLPIYI